MAKRSPYLPEINVGCVCLIERKKQPDEVQKDAEVATSLPGKLL